MINTAWNAAVDNSKNNPAGLPTWELASLFATAARHTLQDATTPAHRDPDTSSLKVWNDSKGWWDIGNDIHELGHVLTEGFAPGEDSNLAYAGRLANKWFLSGTVPSGDLLSMVAVDRHPLDNFVKSITAPASVNNKPATVDWTKPVIGVDWQTLIGNSG
jgi:hypothetical protein